MANRSLAITLSLIIQLSVNTVAQVDSNIYNDFSSFSNKNYIQIDLYIPADEQEDLLVLEPINVIADENTIIQITQETNKILNTGVDKSVEKQERVIDPNKPMIALTYDDGPSMYTQELLDVLKDNNSAATFFVLGLQVNKNKEVIYRMIQEGNQVGNHSFDHKRLTTLNDEELYNQVNNTDNLVYETALYKPYVIRPPYGSTSEDLMKKLQKPIIKWSIDTRDWESRDAETINQIILDNVKDGDIILMHDIYKSSLEASKTVIPELINRGYQLVTVSEMSEYREVTLKAGKSYYNMYK
jgi:peptidoglycan/xylan/chitin deacetylase (PgdA/CDA1 family)